MTEPEKKDTAKKKGGRPKIQLNEKQVVELAKIHCTMKEIAGVMDCSVDTLERNYAEIIKKGKEEGKTTLRHSMWRNAMKGNVTMQIWLSKQLLGMREPQVIEVVREEAKGIFNESYNTMTKT